MYKRQSKVLLRVVCGIMALLAVLPVLLVAIS